MVSRETRLKLEQLVLDGERGVSAALRAPRRSRACASVGRVAKVRLVDVEAEQQRVVLKHRREKRVVQVLRRKRGALFSAAAAARSAAAQACAHAGRRTRDAPAPP